MAGELPVLEKLRKDLADLQYELHNKLPRELEAARAHGDLSENAEYEACKERQGYLTARIGQITARIRELSLYNFSSVPRGVAAYGSSVTLEDLDQGEKVTYELVFPEEADVNAGMISVGSPIGRAVLNRVEGDEVHVQTPRGRKSYQITKLVTLHERIEEE
jgi:transcription elongation factor GreA